LTYDFFDDVDKAKDDAPEFFADGVRFTLGAYSIGIEFSVADFPPPGPATVSPLRTVARVRVSPQLAYAMRHLLNNQIDSYEEQVGKIDLPPKFYGGLEVDT
jgi:hypothetical protein